MYQISEYGAWFHQSRVVEVDRFCPGCFVFGAGTSCKAGGLSRDSAGTRLWIFQGAIRRAESQVGKGTDVEAYSRGSHWRLILTTVDGRIVANHGFHEPFRNVSRAYVGGSSGVPRYHGGKRGALSVGSAR